MVIRSSFLFFVLFFPVFSSAQIVVSEVMYDLEGRDSDREWIEIQNTGGESVNVTEWKLFENKTNHGITAVAGETLAPGAYAVIADDATQFKTDWPSYAGLLFDSAFSINNTGETLILRCCGKDLADKDTVTYSSEEGGAGDGNSLHRSGSSFVSGRPSPGNGSIVAPSAPPPALTPPPPAPTPPLQPQPMQPTPQPVPAPVVQTQTMPPTSPAPQTQVIEQKEETPPPKPVAPKKQKKKVVPVIQEEIEEEPIAEVLPKEALPEKPKPEAFVAAAATPTKSNDWLWWGGAGALSLLGAYGAYAAGRRRGLRDWKIEEIE